jgi:hypothetical protein
MRFLLKIKLIVIGMELVDLEQRPVIVKKIPLAMINIIRKRYVLLQIGGTDQMHCTLGFEATECTEHPAISKSNVQVLRYLFPLESLWRHIVKDTRVAWSRRLLFPSPCAAWHTSRRKFDNTGEEAINSRERKSIFNSKLVQLMARTLVITNRTDTPFPPASACF